MKEDVLFCDKKHFSCIKGLAIIMVMISHGANNSGVSWFTPLGGIGVALFLFCSGYGIFYSLTKNNGLVFWKHRILNVYLDFLMIEVLAAAIYRRDLFVFIKDIFLIKPVNIYFWYLQYLLVCYFIIWAISRFVKEEKIKIGVIISSMVVSFIAFYMLNDNLRAEQTFSFGGGYVFAMLMSRKGFNYNLFCNKKCKYVITTLIAFIMATIFLFVKQLPLVRFYQNTLIIPINLIMKTSAAIGIILISYPLSKMTDAFGLVGKISYPLYLVHAYTIIIVSQKIFGGWYMSAFMFFVISIACSIVWYVLSEYIKSKIKTHI